MMLTLSRHSQVPAEITALTAGGRVQGTPAAWWEEEVKSTVGAFAYIGYFRHDIGQSHSRLGRVQSDPPFQARAVAQQVTMHLAETQHDTWTAGGPGITSLGGHATVAPFTKDSDGNYVKCYGGYLISDANLENPICSSKESNTVGSRSMGCGAVMLGGVAVDFFSSRAASMAADTTVAELLAIVNTMLKGIIVRRCLVAIGFPEAVETSWTHFSDCEGAIKVCCNTTAPKRSLWVARKARLGQELVDSGEFQPEHCDGERNPTDSGTKPKTARRTARDMGFIMGSPPSEWDTPATNRLWAFSKGRETQSEIMKVTSDESAAFEAAFNEAPDDADAVTDPEALDSLAPLPGPTRPKGMDHVIDDYISRGVVGQAAANELEALRNIPITEHVGSHYISRGDALRWLATQPDGTGEAEARVPTHGAVP